MRSNIEKTGDPRLHENGESEEIAANPRNPWCDSGKTRRKKRWRNP